MNREQRTLLTLLALAAPKSAAGGSSHATAEGFVHQQGTLAEVKANTSIGNVFNVRYFLRERLGVDYKGNPSNFLLNDLSIPIWYGVRGSGQLRLAGQHLIPTTGVDRLFLLGGMGSLWLDLKVLFADPELLGEIHLVGGYTHQGVRFELEHVLNGTQDRITGATTRGHVGYKVTDELLVGIAGETRYVPQKPIDIPLGVFVRIGP